MTCIQKGLQKLITSRSKKENKCWVWTGYCNKNGYGNIKRIINGILFQGAHRLSYFAFKGMIQNNLYVLHTCDIPSCVNPKHLFLGTARDNTLDMVKKGRHGRQDGEYHSQAILTWEIVNQIKKLYGTKQFTQKELGKKFSTDPTNISRIVNGNRWGGGVLRV